MKTKVKEVQKRIEEVLPKGDWKIYEAISYTPKIGGKKLRANLMLEVAEDLGVDGMIDAAVAVELFHSGTLIHDDMPEIDDAKMRRGRPANHVVFGQNMALLAGDGLFFLAFQMISNYPNLFRRFSEVAMDVLIGEAMDVELEEKREFSEKDILEMYEKKTGALFGFSMSAPLIVRERDWKDMDEVGRKFGIAFQIYDDVKDLTMDESEIGKDVGKDVNKKTLIKLWGIEKAKSFADDLVERSLSFLEENGYEKTAGFLRNSLDLIRKG